jgi:hypothetical protein
MAKDREVARNHRGDVATCPMAHVRLHHSGAVVLVRLQMGVGP